MPEVKLLSFLHLHPKMSSWKATWMPMWVTFEYRRWKSRGEVKATQGEIFLSIMELGFKCSRESTEGGKINSSREETRIPVGEEE